MTIQVRCDKSKPKEKLRRKALRAFARWEKLTPEAADVVACWELEE